MSQANASVSKPMDVSKADGDADVLRLPGVDGPSSPIAQPVGSQLGLQLGLQLGPGKVTLYHFPTSLYSQQVRLVLAEKGVEWESKTVNIGPAHEHFAPWYAKINPRLVVPTLEIDGTIVADSAHIIQYIDHHFDGPALMPDSPKAEAEALEWIEREAALPMRELGYARTKGITRWLQRWSLRQRRKQLAKLRKRNLDLDEVYAAKLADLDALELALKDRGAMSEVVDRVELLLDQIEATLADRRWLAGDRYSIADLVWTANIAKLEHIGFARSISQHRRPRVHEWYARLRDRPSWGSMIRRLTPTQVARFYGPAAIRAFLIFWVLKWTLVGGGLWLLKHLVSL